MLVECGHDDSRKPGYRPLDLKKSGGATRPARILVVEDERHIARLLEFVLNKVGYETYICHSGEHALLEIERKKPDALVLDLVLPGMSGLELLRTIRAAPYCCDCVVVVLSSHWFEHAAETVAQAGASAQCSKPIAPTTLLRKLQQLGIHLAMPMNK